MKPNIFSHFSSGLIVNSSDCHTTFAHKLKSGSLSATVYPIIQGIEFVELVIEAKRYSPVINKHNMILEINYCHQGRMECKMNDGCFQYVGEGDLFLNMVSNHSDSIEFPLGSYLGTTVMVDLEAANSSIKELLPNMQIDLDKMTKRLFNQDDCLCLLLSARDIIQHMFSDLFAMPDEAKTAFIRLKILEMMIYLNYLDVDRERKKKTYTRMQVDIIKQIHAQITENAGERYTINDLAHQYCISPTTLKSNFKGVYGSSIAAYMKAFRIKQGAVLLRDTQKNIAEIAKEMGYESQSKFGAAFKDIMKISPKDYRNKFE